MPAAGKVITGFSKPYVAVYNNSGGTVTYTSGQQLARGVNVNVDVETADDNKFYADNVAAESAQGRFRAGTLTLIVDGLYETARRLIYGLPEPEEITVNEQQVEVTDYGDAQQIPYMGIGWIVRYQSDGVVTYSPQMLTKSRFNQGSETAATQEEDIDWQTEELTAAISRDDTADHNWKRLAADQPTEAAAEAVLKVMLGITPAAAASTTSQGGAAT